MKKHQYEAVITVMEGNGGYATLGYLNQNVFKIPGIQWKTNTPFASVRRIVQDERFFFRIRPGLWALKSHRDKLPPDVLPSEQHNSKIRLDYSHSYYQGLLVELGNFKQYETFVPNQDKNKPYLGKSLSEFVTCEKMYRFSYESFIGKAQQVDVVWFNERKMPAYFFEVEHTTDISNSLLKFLELQDFNAMFRIVADTVRLDEFKKKLSMIAFKPMINRVKFLDYEKVALLHAGHSTLFKVHPQWSEGEC